MRDHLPSHSLAVAVLIGAAVGVGAEPLGSKFELFVSRLDRSIVFYRVLGFEVFHQKDGGYTTLRSGDTVVALSPVPSWLPLHWLGFLRYPPLGTELVFYTTRLEGLRVALEEAGHDPGEIKRQPWGDRDFRVTDPNGYYVRLSEGEALPAAK